MKQSKIYTLKNGLKVVFYQDTTKHLSFAELIVKYGGINNKFTLNNKEYHINDGMAHFLEHLLIEHSIYGNVFEYFQNNHISTNGLTSFKHTKFYIKTAKNFLDNLEKLIRIVNQPVFNREDIENTKPAIYEEIRKGKDNEFKELFNLEYSCLFNNIDAKSVLGEIDDIKNINYEMTKLCHDVFYQPQNQILAIAGNVDIEKTLELIEKVYQEINTKKINYQIPIKVEQNRVAKKNDFIYRNIENNFVRIVYKIDISSLAPYERVKLTFYIDYFLNYNFDETSINYKKLIDNKISINNINSNVNFIDNFMIISIDTYTSKYDEFINLIKEAIERKNINKEDFEIRKKRTLINLLLREDNFMSMINPFIDNILSFDYYENDTIEDIEKENYEEYSNMINLLDFSNYTIIKMLKKEN